MTYSAYLAKMNQLLTIADYSQSPAGTKELKSCHQARILESKILFPCLDPLDLLFSKGEKIENLDWDYRVVYETDDLSDASMYYIRP